MLAFGLFSLAFLCVWIFSLLSLCISGKAPLLANKTIRIWIAHLADMGTSWMLTQSAEIFLQWLTGSVEWLKVFEPPRLLWSLSGQLNKPCTLYFVNTSPLLAGIYVTHTHPSLLHTRHFHSPLLASHGGWESCLFH